MNLLRTFTCGISNQTVNIVAIGAKEKYTYQEFAVATAADIFEGATDSDARTMAFTNWLNIQSDGIKAHFRLNWTMGHRIFNVACNYFEGKDIQNINWFKIYKGDMPIWSHQNN